MIRFLDEVEELGRKWPGGIPALQNNRRVLCPLCLSEVAFFGDGVEFLPCPHLVFAPGVRPPLWVELYDALDYEFTWIGEARSDPELAELFAELDAAHPGEHIICPSSCEWPGSSDEHYVFLFPLDSPAGSGLLATLTSAIDAGMEDEDDDRG